MLQRSQENYNDGKKEQLTKMSGHKDRRLNTISGILLQYLIC